MLGSEWNYIHYAFEGEFIVNQLLITQHNKAMWGNALRMERNVAKGIRNNIKSQENDMLDVFLAHVPFAYCAFL